MNRVGIDAALDKVFGSVPLVWGEGLDSGKVPFFGAFGEGVGVGAFNVTYSKLLSTAVLTAGENLPAHESRPGSVLPAEDQYETYGIIGLVQPVKSCVFITLPSIVQTARFAVTPVVGLGPIDQEMQNFEELPRIARSPVLVNLPSRDFPSWNVFR